jgi:hypothetical protein
MSGFLLPFAEIEDQRPRHQVDLALAPVPLLGAVVAEPEGVALAG